jgi:hypothetical protein
VLPPQTPITLDRELRQGSCFPSLTSNSRSFPSLWCLCSVLYCVVHRIFERQRVVPISSSSPSFRCVLSNRGSVSEPTDVSNSCFLVTLLVPSLSFGFLSSSLQLLLASFHSLTHGSCEVQELLASRFLPSFDVSSRILDLVPNSLFYSTLMQQNLTDTWSC